MSEHGLVPVGGEIQGVAYRYECLCRVCEQQFELANERAERVCPACIGHEKIAAALASLVAAAEACKQAPWGEADLLTLLNTSHLVDMIVRCFLPPGQGRRGNKVTKKEAA